MPSEETDVSNTMAAFSEAMVKLGAMDLGQYREQVHEIVACVFDIASQRNTLRARVAELEAECDRTARLLAILRGWRNRWADVLQRATPTDIDITEARNRWSEQEQLQRSAPRGSAMRKVVDAAQCLIQALEQTDEWRRARHAAAINGLIGDASMLEPELWRDDTDKEKTDAQ